MPTAVFFKEIKKKRKLKTLWFIHLVDYQIAGKKNNSSDNTGQRN